ncbi:THAP domain-containing protein [Ooceraea biroi]|uniref:THAP domain-containing protein n=1 Tax=Ooceraea biroi TaxID=2015173 RepID=A0A026VY20_OOCBI|nr:THAP domain-containing protein [Ooceraea biroi]
MSEKLSIHAFRIQKLYVNGINREALAFIKQRVKNANHKLLGALMLDEMAIRQHIEYDGKQFVGYYDVGNNITNEECSIAKEALVFLVVGINELWKIPVAYFLINGINGEQKANLIIQCLSLLHDCGIHIKTVTRDGAACNLSMFRSLQCNMDPEHLQTWFVDHISKSKIYVFLDPCHMVKLLRNIFGDYKNIKNKNNENISWEYIVSLHELQQNKGLHMGNKLRTGHIEYHKKKMNVRFAAQIFSSSVANALQMCRSVLHIDKFAQSEATEEFLQMMNDLFDIFNSRNLRQKFYERPINPDNYESVLYKLKECKEYLLNLKFENGQLVVRSNRKTGVLGFLINIESLKMLYQDICDKEQILPYIPLYQISQDHLEIFFGCIRAFGRQNNNPTVRQFKAAFKRLLLRTEIKGATTGNCIALDDIPILNATYTITTRGSNK